MLSSSTNWRTRFYSHIITLVFRTRLMMVADDGANGNSCTKHINSFHIVYSLFTKLLAGALAGLSFWGSSASPLLPSPPPEAVVRGVTPGKCSRFYCAVGEFKAQFYATFMVSGKGFHGEKLLRWYAMYNRVVSLCVVDL